jgi:hypothetical protein
MLFHIRDLQRSLELGYRVGGGKGDSTLKDQEKSQANFTNTLRSAFSTQFGKFGGTLDFLNSKLTAMIDHPTGYSPEALAAMQAEQALHASEAARGGSQLPSGVNAQLEAANANAGAATNEASQQQITLNNEQLKEDNYNRAIAALSGVAQTENPAGLAANATGSAEAVGQLGTAYKNSQSSQLLGALGGIAGAAGTAAGAYFTGGASLALKAKT